jgi:hypothetical protein
VSRLQIGVVYPQTELQGDPSAVRRIRRGGRLRVVERCSVSGERRQASFLNAGPVGCSGEQPADEREDPEANEADSPDPGQHVVKVRPDESGRISGAVGRARSDESNHSARDETDPSPDSVAARCSRQPRWCTEDQETSGGPRPARPFILKSPLPV